METVAIAFWIAVENYSAVYALQRLILFCSRVMAGKTKLATVTVVKKYQW